MLSAYLHCFAGISGDMCLGALVDAGVQLSDLEKGLHGLRVKGYRLKSRKVSRNGIAATKVDVTVDARNRVTEVRWHDISAIVSGSSLNARIKEKGIHIFKRLFAAEAKVHGKSLNTVHLHELGGVDCLVDIFGTLIALDILGVEKVFSSPVNLGSGLIGTAHGLLPVPAPATAELLKGYPVYSTNVPFELTTPTGAALLSGLTARCTALPQMEIQQIGYGAGSRDMKSHPNTLRIFVGKDLSPSSPTFDTAGEITVIESNIDDMNPQIYDEVLERLLAAGALDVFLENIIMKKGRPAIKLSVIAKEQDVTTLTNIIFRETTTIGVRFYGAERRVLDREIRKIRTKYGEVRIKLSRLGGDLLTVSPEYEDVKALSKKKKLPVRKILEEIPQLYRHDSPG